MAQTTAGSGRVVGDYLVGRQIGSGSFSVVWEAIKEIAMGRLNKKLQDSLMSEIFILRRIKHPNIICLLDMINSTGKIHSVLEYCKGGDMSVYIQRHGSVPEAKASDDPLEKITTTEAIRLLVYYYHTSDYYYTAKAKVEEISQYKGTILDSGGSQASFLLQAHTLTKRSFINMSRDFGYYWLRLLIYILVTFCIETIYWKVGTSYCAILARGSCASFVFGVVTFMSIGEFPSFVDDMKVNKLEKRQKGS